MAPACPRASLRRPRPRGDDSRRAGPAGATRVSPPPDGVEEEQDQYQEENIKQCPKLEVFTLSVLLSDVIERVITRKPISELFVL